MEKRTEELLSVLRSGTPEQVGAILEDNKEELFEEEHPFRTYLRELLEQHGVTQQHVIDAAGFSTKYGYRLLSGERHTNQRDYLLRICLAAGLTLEETQRLLQLYGMSPLYARIPRDALLLTIFSTGGYAIDQVNALLEGHRMPPLRASGEEDSTNSGG